MSEENRETSHLEELSAVLKGSKLGDSQAETKLYETFVARLVRLASSRINERFRAKIEPEEIVQSVFVSFFRRHKEGEFSFEGWNDLWALLVKITVRKCSKKVDNFLAAKRDVSREVAGKATSTHDSSVNAVAGQPSPEDIAIFNETLDHLFDQLPESLQTIVCLRLKGLSNTEISQKVNRSERTIYRSLNQVRDIFLELDRE